MISLSLIVVLIHAGLLEALRDNVQFLYIVYIVIAVGLSVLYLVLEPHLAFSLRERVSAIFGAEAAGMEGNPDGRSADTSANSSSANTPAESGSVEARSPRGFAVQARAFDKLTGQELRVTELILLVERN